MLSSFTSRNGTRVHWQKKSTRRYWQRYCFNRQKQYRLSNSPADRETVCLIVRTCQVIPGIPGIPIYFCAAFPLGVFAGNRRGLVYAVASVFAPRQITTVFCCDQRSTDKRFTVRAKCEISTLISLFPHTSKHGNIGSP